MVGRAARASAMMLKNIAIFPSLVINHRHIPRMDSPPHARSNFETFQTAFLLRKDAITTNKGIKPTINVINDCRPTPLSSSAAKATSGATVQSSQVTLFGLVLPFKVLKAYLEPPINDMTAPIITKWGSSIWVFYTTSFCGRGRLAGGVAGQGELSWVRRL